MNVNVLMVFDMMMAYYCHSSSFAIVINLMSQKYSLTNNFKPDMTLLFMTGI